MGKSTISMSIFNSYVSLPEGNLTWLKPPTYSEIFIWAWQSPTNSQKVPHQILKKYRCMWWNISWHSGWWYTYPSETYESQVGWLFSTNGTIKAMFQNTNQINMWCIDMYSVSCDFDSDYQSPWKSQWKTPLITMKITINHHSIPLTTIKYH